jgi:hypothetical protein
VLLLALTLVQYDRYSITEYWTSKLINLLLFPSFPNSHHLRANFPNYKGAGPQIQMSRKITTEAFHQHEMYSSACCLGRTGRHFLLFFLAWVKIYPHFIIKTNERQRNIIKQSSILWKNMIKLSFIYVLIFPIIREPGPRYKWVGKSLR